MNMSLVIGIIYLLYAGFLSDLFFDYEDGCNMFVRNVGWISKVYMKLYSFYDYCMRSYLKVRK
jgi:hypothetical protein